VSGVGVAERAELLVITADEGGARVDAFGSLDEATIEADTEFGHGVRLIDVGPGEQLDAAFTEDILRDGEEMCVVLAASGDVEQAEQDALWAGAKGVIEVAAGSHAKGSGCKLPTIDYWKWRGDGFDGGFGSGLAG
jgi:hypothetical protein